MNGAVHRAVEIWFVSGEWACCKHTFHTTICTDETGAGRIRQGISQVASEDVCEKPRVCAHPFFTAQPHGLLV